jgi:predicted phosphodiesterase
MRILIISDIHSNLAALEAVLEAANEQGFDKVWCLGDIVGYGPAPNECTSEVQDLKALSIAGNHDWGALGKIPLEDFNPDAMAASLWTRANLTPENMCYLERQPEMRFQGEFTLAHGSPRFPIWEYIQLPSVATANFAHFNTPYCLVGHTHVPVVFRATDRLRVEMFFPQLDTPLSLGKERLIVNPGSVGQPRDGDSRASYAMLHEEARMIEFHRVVYPIGDTQARMKDAGLPRRLAERLVFGW